MLLAEPGESNKFPRPTRQNPADMQRGFVIRVLLATPNHIGLSVNSKGLKYPWPGPTGSSLYPPSLAPCEARVILITFVGSNQYEQPRGRSYKSSCYGPIASSFPSPLTDTRGSGTRADGLCQSSNQTTPATCHRGGPQIVCRAEPGRRDREH